MWGNLYIPCLLLIIALRFTGGEKKNLVKHYIVSNHYENDYLNNFLLLLMSLMLSCEMAKYGKVLFSISQQFFASINKIFWGGRRPGHKVIILWSFEIFLTFRNFLTKILSLMSFGNLWGNSYIPCFITNNRTSFHLRWKKNLVKHQKVSKYHENDCE